MVRQRFLRFMGKDEYERLLAGEVLVHPNPDHGKRRYTGSKGFCFFDIDGYGDDLSSIEWYHEFTDGIVDEYVAVVFESDGDGLMESYGIYANPYGSWFDTWEVTEYSTLSYSRETMVPIRSYMHFSKYDRSEVQVNELWEGGDE